MKYQIILADPPWSYDDKCLERGGAERHYRTMEFKDIGAMPVAGLAAKDCVLFMWATFPKLWEALWVIQQWDFVYKTCAFVWIKANKLEDVKQVRFIPEDNFDSFWGMGRWTRSNAEICLLATRGSPSRKAADVHQIVYEPVSKHSEKPACVRDRILKLMGDLPRVELFARRKTDGWDVFGNEVDSDVTLEVPK